MVYVLGKSLTTEQYGVYALILTALTFGTPIVGFSVHTYLVRHLPGLNLDRQVAIFRTTFVFEVLAASLWVGVLYGSGAFDYCLGILKMTQYRSEAMVGLVLQVGMVAASETQYFLTGQKRIEVANVVDYICQSACVWPLLIAWLAGYKLTLISILIANCVGYCAGAVYGVRKSGACSMASFSFALPTSPPGLLERLPTLRAALSYSLPLMIVSVSFYGTKLTDRFFLSHYTNLAEVGIYSFTFAFLNMMYSLTSQVIELTIWPYVCEAHDKQDADRSAMMLGVGLKWSLILFTAGAAVLWTAPNLIVRILARPSYAGGRPVIAILTMGFLAMICGHFASYSFMLRRDMLRLMVADLAGAAMAIIGSAMLVPRYSYIGAAISTAAALSMSAGLKYVISKGGAFRHMRALLSFDTEKLFIRSLANRYATPEAEGEM
jgi:O-antigen/teichoic acid export membrane protein